MVLIDQNDELKLLDQWLYEAYRAADGDLPTWGQCSPEVRGRWAAVADAAAEWAALENAPEE